LGGQAVHALLKSSSDQLYIVLLQSLYTARETRLVYK
jgi:hypothetical protein